MYFSDSVARDPITLTLIATGVLLAVHSRSASLNAIAGGIIFYLFYVLSIGGDFMSGRFLTAPLVTAAVIVSRARLSTLQWVAIALILVIVGSLSLHATILSGTDYADNSMPANGINDERGFMFPGRGLTTATKGFFAQPQWMPGQQSLTVQCGLLGSAALYGGPDAHFIDSCALTDPLLARLPVKVGPSWRIGHFERQLPSGYDESIMKGENLLVDPATRKYWDVIRAATRGPLLSMNRFVAIARLNLGLVEKPNRADPEALSVDLKSLSFEPVTGIEWYKAPNLPFETSLEVRLPRPMRISSIDVSLVAADKYLVEYRTSNGGYARLVELGPTQNHWGMNRYKSVISPGTPATDRLRITAEAGDGQYAVGHLLLNR